MQLHLSFNRMIVFMTLPVVQKRYTIFHMYLYLFLFLDETSNVGADCQWEKQDKE